MIPAIAAELAVHAGQHGAAEHKDETEHPWEAAIQI
jgi:hypothetical protein